MSVEYTEGSLSKLMVCSVIGERLSPKLWVLRFSDLNFRILSYGNGICERRLECSQIGFFGCFAVSGTIFLPRCLSTIVFELLFIDGLRVITLHTCRNADPGALSSTSSFRIALVSKYCIWLWALWFPAKVVEKSTPQGMFLKICVYFDASSRLSRSCYPSYTVIG